MLFGQYICAFGLRNRSSIMISLRPHVTGIWRGLRSWQSADVASQWRKYQRLDKTPKTVHVPFSISQCGDVFSQIGGKISVSLKQYHEKKRLYNVQTERADLS